jgi:autophagy-related protein 16-1
MRAASGVIPSRAWKVLTAHRGECTAVQHNFSGSLFATTSNDKTLHLWDARTGTSRSVLHGAVQTLMGVAFSPNDELVLGVSTDNSARIWSISQGRVLHTLTGHLNKVFQGTETDARLLVNSRPLLNTRMLILSLSFDILFVFL